jgi:hypothetical protein
MTCNPEEVLSDSSNKEDSDGCGMWHVAGELLAFRERLCSME